MMNVPTNAPTLSSNNNNPYPPRTFPYSSETNVSKLPGYYIENENDIIPKYIPMDGSISFFPYKNLSKIIIKQWDANGLNTLVYTLAPPPSQAQQSQNIQTPDQPVVVNNQVAPATSDPLTKSLMDTMQGINDGLANTFGQISQNMGKMQAQIDQMAKVMMNEFGGRG